MWGVLRVMAVAFAALLFLTVPILLRDAVPDGLFDLWDGVIEPLRTPVNGFWWRYFHRYDQQPLFQLSTLLTMVAVITVVVEVMLWAWRRRTV